MATYHVTRVRDFNTFVSDDGTIRWQINGRKMYDIKLDILVDDKSKLYLCITADQAEHLAESEEIVLYECSSDGENFIASNPKIYKKQDVFVAVVKKNKHLQDPNEIVDAFRHPECLTAFSVTIIHRLSSVSDETLRRAIICMQNRIKASIKKKEENKQKKADTSQPEDDSSIEEDSSSSVVTSLFDTARNVPEEEAVSSSAPSSFSKKKEYAEECFNLGMTKEEIAQKMGLPISSIEILLS